MMYQHVIFQRSFRFNSDFRLLIQDGLPSAKAKCGCVPLPRLASAKVDKAWLGLLPLHENRELFGHSYSCGI